MKSKINFDIQLKPKLPVNEWDGTKSTKLAVIPDKFLSQEESENILLTFRNEKHITSDIETNESLYIGLNKMYEFLRS